MHVNVGSRFLDAYITFRPLVTRIFDFDVCDQPAHLSAFVLRFGQIKKISVFQVTGLKLTLG